jgi:hypothetical protein
MGARLGTNRRDGVEATESPTVPDMAWAAGFLEGEGHFTRYSSEQIRVKQVQAEPLEKMQRLFGGSLELCRRNCYEWILCGQRARGLMMSVYVLMSPKRQEEIKWCLHPDRVERPIHGTRPYNSTSKTDRSKREQKVFSVVSPDGTVYENIAVLTYFCNEHGLSRPLMSHVLSGKRKTHKGWTKL